MTPTGGGKRQRAKKNVKKTPWQEHGGALVDYLGKKGIDRLKGALGLNTETKHADATFSTGVTGTVTQRCAFPTIPQGDTPITRNGSSIRVTQIQWRVDFQAAAAATTGTQIRILVVGNRNPGAVASADLLTTSTNFSSMVDAQINAHGLNVFSDEIITVGFKEASNSNVSWIKNLNVGDNWHAIYDDSDTAGAPASLLRGGIEVWWIADAISTAPSANGKARVWFVDN